MKTALITDYFTLFIRIVVVKFRKLIFFFFSYIDENLQLYLVDKLYLCGNVHPRQSLLDKNLSIGYNLSDVSGQIFPLLARDNVLLIA